MNFVWFWLCSIRFWSLKIEINILEYVKGNAWANSNSSYCWVENVTFQIDENFGIVSCCLYCWPSINAELERINDKMNCLNCAWICRSIFTSCKRRQKKIPTKMWWCTLHSQQTDSSFWSIDFESRTEEKKTLISG